jgi:hypothetical protein
MAKMAEDPRRRTECRRALELLDASCDGCTEAIMQARGVTIEMLVDLVRDGLATVHRRPARMRRACRWRLRVRRSPRQGGGRSESLANAATARCLGHRSIQNISGVPQGDLSPPPW